MAAYDSPAIRTFPFVPLLNKQSAYTFILDGFKVLNHAHPEEVSISLVYMLEAFARETTTFITILDSAIQEEIAPLFKEGALLISRPAAGTIRHSDSLTSHIVFERKVSATYRTVHPTRSD